MKGKICLWLSTTGLMVCLLAAAQIASAQPHGRNFGMGVVLGEPSGITGKLWQADQNAFSGTAAWSFRGQSTIHLHLDYQRHNFDIISPQTGSMALYYGVGGRLLVGDRDRAGIRIPLGISYFFVNEPLELFFEVAPILDLIPGTEFSGNSGFGVRYYF